MQLKYLFEERSHQGNVRIQNEDSHFSKETQNGHLFVLCDGMGGAAEGKKASELGVNSIGEYFENQEFDNISIAIQKSIEFANEQIFATAQAYPSYKGMGTTACITLIKDNLIYIAHVGDSRIYLFSDENLYQLTKDHSYVNQLVDQNLITVEEAKTHKDKNRINKALGVSHIIEPTISSEPIKLKKRDQLLICSDGLSDMVSHNEMILILSEKSTIVEKSDKLLDLALKNGGKDNVTFQLIEVIESPFKNSTFIDKTLYYQSNPITIGKRKKSKFLLVALLLLALILGLLAFYIFNQPGKLKKTPQSVIDTINKKNTDKTKNTLKWSENQNKIIKEEKINIQTESNTSNPKAIPKPDETPNTTTNKNKVKEEK